MKSHGDRDDKVILFGSRFNPISLFESNILTFGSMTFDCLHPRHSQLPLLGSRSMLFALQSLGSRW